MKKSNPLFVDSTKFQGDQILTKLQLRAPQVESRCQFVVDILRQDQESRRVQMVWDAEDRAWRGQIHLEHLEPIIAQVILTTASQLEVHGPRHETCGTAVLEFDWEFNWSWGQGADQQREPQVSLTHLTSVQTTPLLLGPITESNSTK